MRDDEGELQKFLYVTMSVVSPTAFSGIVAELEERTNEEWQQLATTIDFSPTMDAFIAELNGNAVGFATATILTKQRLAPIAENNCEDESLSDTTIWGRIYVAPEA